MDAESALFDYAADFIVPDFTRVIAFARASGSES